MNYSDLPQRIILHLTKSDCYSCLQALQISLESSGWIRALLIVGENLELCQNIERVWFEVAETTLARSEAGGYLCPLSNGAAADPATTAATIALRQYVSQDYFAYEASSDSDWGVTNGQEVSPSPLVHRPFLISKFRCVQMVVMPAQTLGEESPSGVSASIVVLSTGLNVWIQVEPVRAIANESPIWQVSWLFEPQQIAQLLRSPALAKAIPHCSALTAQDLRSRSNILRRLCLHLLPLAQPTSEDMSDAMWVELEEGSGRRGDGETGRREDGKKSSSGSSLLTHHPLPTNLRSDLLFWESPVGILYQSLDGGILKANPAFENLIGYTETQLRHLDCRAITYPEDFAAEVRLIQQLLQVGLQRPRFKKRYLRRDGGIVWAEVVMHLIGEAEAEESYLLLFVTDLSFERQAEQEIQQRREREALLSEIAAQIRSTFDFPTILQIAVKRLRQALDTDRVIAYQLQSDQSGVCAAEAVNPTYPAMIGQHLSAECIPPNYLEAYRQGRLWCATDIYAEGLSDCYRRMLEQLKVRSAIAVAIQRANEHQNSNGFISPNRLHSRTLWGLLAIHHCRAPRQWTGDEQQLVQAVANQIAIAFEQASLVKQLQVYTQELEERVQQRTRSLERSLQFEQLIRSLTETLRQDLDEDQMLRAAVEGLVTTLGVDGCYASLFNVQEELLEVRYEHFKDERATRAIAASSSIQGQNPSLVDRYLPFQNCSERCRKSLLAGKTYFLRTGDWQKGTVGEWETERRGDEEHLPFPTTHYRVVLISPVVDEQGLMGTISVLVKEGAHWEEETRTFDSDEVQLIEQVASQCAIAIRQSRTWQCLQQKNQELATINRLKEELIANTSHELRTPLTAILGFSSVLLQECFGELNAKQKDYVDRIYGSGQHLLELINDILDLSRLEAGRLELELEAVFIADICESAIALVREQAREHGLTLEVDLDPDLEYVVADARRLKQVLLNLLSNAVKFTPAGTVGLKVYRARQKVDGYAVERVHFLVWDTGIGISPTEQTQLFSPFAQIDSSVSRKYAGTGLGLAIARKLAELHGGRILLESRRGQGSRFTLELPLHPSPQALEQPKD